MLLDKKNGFILNINFEYDISAVEYCGVKTRTYPLLAVMASYTTASLAIPLLAKILPAWRSMKMIAVFPNLLVIGAYFVGWIPESLSWLICKNQMDKARTALVNVAKINQKDLEVCYKIVAYKKMSYHIVNHIYRYLWTLV